MSFYKVSLVVIYIFTTRGQNLHVIRSNHVARKQLEARRKEENRGNRNESWPKKGCLTFLKKCIKDIYTEINLELHISYRSWRKPCMCFFVFLNYPVIRLHQHTHTHTPVVKEPRAGMSKASQLATDKRLIHLITLMRVPPSIATGWHLWHFTEATLVTCWHLGRALTMRPVSESKSY